MPDGPEYDRKIKEMTPEERADRFDVGTDQFMAMFYYMFHYKVATISQFVTMGQFIKQEQSDPAEIKEPVSDEERMMLRSFRQFRARNPTGSVFQWRTSGDVPIVTGDACQLIVHPQAEPSLCL